MLAGDAILNYKTVASFAHDEIIVSEYEKYLEGPLKKITRKAHCIALAFGYS